MMTSLPGDVLDRSRIIGVLQWEQKVDPWITTIFMEWSVDQPLCPCRCMLSCLASLFYVVVWAVGTKLPIAMAVAPLFFSGSQSDRSLHCDFTDMGLHCMMCLCTLQPSLVLMCTYQGMSRLSRPSWLVISPIPVLAVPDVERLCSLQLVCSH